MKTRVLCAIGALLLSPALAAAQTAPTGTLVRLFFAEVPSLDSVYAVLPGGEFDVSVNAQDANYFGVGAFTLRMYFDPAKLSFVSARSICPDAATAPLNTPVTGPSYVELSASGCNSASQYSHGVVAVRFLLSSGAVDGTVLFVRPVGITDRMATDRTLDAVGEIAEVCAASGLWGDVDADGLINSRDALIALTHAVGLPTGAFEVWRGDADGDGVVSSRDALGMLSASIGMEPDYGFRTGKAMVGRCAPQAVLPRPLFYDRAGVGNGLTLRPAGDSSFSTVAGSSADADMYYRWRPRVSPDGTKVLYACARNMDYSGNPRICRANIDGTGVAFAATTWDSLASEYSPDWSPDGARIVFIRSGALYTMNADGSNVALVNPALSTNFMTVAWHPVTGSDTLAFTTTSGVVRIGSLVDSLTFANQRLVFGIGSMANTFDPSMIEWSPGGDSLAFDLQIDNNRAVIVTGTQASAPLQPRVPIYNYPTGSYHFTYPLWTDLGVFFVVNLGGSSGRSRIFLQKPDGTIWRIGREAIEAGGVNNFAPGTGRLP